MIEVSWAPWTTNALLRWAQQVDLCMRAEPLRPFKALVSLFPELCAESEV